MRFCDLFISYQIGLKSIKSNIPFTKLPTYKKLAVVLAFIVGIALLFISICQKTIYSIILIIVISILILIYSIHDRKKDNLTVMLEQHYLPFSDRRMKMLISVLDTFKIDTNDATAIDLLISEAEKAQIQSDYFLPLKKPIKVLWALILPITLYILQYISSDLSPEALLNYTMIFLLVIIWIIICFMASFSTLKDILYRDYRDYNNLIYDLNQLKIFGSNSHTTVEANSISTEP